MAHDVERPRRVICVLVASGDTPGFAPSRAWSVSVEDGVGMVGSQRAFVCIISGDCKVQIATVWRREL